MKETKTPLYNIILNNFAGKTKVDKTHGVEFIALSMLGLEEWGVLGAQFIVLEYFTSC